MKMNNANGAGPEQNNANVRRLPWLKPVPASRAELTESSLRELLWNMDESALATDAARRIDALLEAARESEAAPADSSGAAVALTEAA